MLPPEPSRLLKRVATTISRSLLPTSCPESWTLTQVSYVLDTEDIFRRLKTAMPVVRHEVVAAKSAKFRRWDEA